MKQLFALLAAAMLLTGCKKTMERIAEDMVVKAMTDGQWKVTTFTQNGTDITASFTGYKFQYHKNKTVDAYKDSGVPVKFATGACAEEKPVNIDMNSPANIRRRLISA